MLNCDLCNLRNVYFLRRCLNFQETGQPENRAGAPCPGVLDLSTDAPYRRERQTGADTTTSTFTQSSRPAAACVSREATCTVTGSLFCNAPSCQGRDFPSLPHIFVGFLLQMLTCRAQSLGQRRNLGLASEDMLTRPEGLLQGVRAPVTGVVSPAAQPLHCKGGQRRQRSAQGQVPHMP
jgi:hypothetical protein